MIKTLLVVMVLSIAIYGIFLAIAIRYNCLVDRIWRSLKSEPTDTVFTPEMTDTVFTPEMIANLDRPVQKYFLHAIAPGTPLAKYVELEMSGSFKPKPNADWLPMQASQIISTSPGFVWKAKIGKGLTKFRGADYYSENKGRMKFSIWGLIPVVDAHNKNITRSGIGRLGAEYIWLPPALLPQNGVAWQAIAHNTIQANFRIDGEPITLTLTIDADGKLLKVFLPRWGDQTENGNCQYIPFGGEVQAEETFAGYTVPTKISAGWWFGTDKYAAFFQPTIDRAKFSN